MSFTIPADIENVYEYLDDLDRYRSNLDRLVTATEWERAAIVAAFVEFPGQGSRSDLLTSEEVMSPERFAALGIAGLKSSNTVRRYVNAWQSTGRPRPNPGETVELPTTPWPPSETTQDAVKKNAKSVAALLATDDDFLVRIVSLMDADTKDVLVKAIIDRGESDEDSTPRPRDTDKPRDYGRLIEGAINNLSMALAAASSGRWVPSSRDEALLYFATRLLGERLAPEGAAELVPSKLTANLEEIERYANAGGTR